MEEIVKNILQDKHGYGEHSQAQFWELEHILIEEDITKLIEKYVAKQQEGYAYIIGDTHL